MLGKRKMKRTSSVSLIGSGSGNGDGSPVPEHPKERKSSNFPSPGACCAAPRQVIGFHPSLPKGGFIDEEELPSSPISPHRAVSSPRSSSSGKSPSGSPRSGLGDLLAGSRPWERKDEGVGLGIVAALSGSQEEVCSKEQEDGRGYGARRTSPPPHPHVQSAFAPSRGSPPIPIHVSPLHSNSGRHSPSHCTNQNCCPAVALGLAPPSYRQEVTFDVNSVHQNGGGRGGSRPNSAAPNGAHWARPGGHNGVAAVNWTHNEHMEVDGNELHAIVSPSPAHLVRHHASSSSGFRQNFLDACHLCRRRLDEGRDIYIYRGDRAFCSPECRHQQILNDERSEKCAAAVMKVGGGSDVRNTTQRSRVIPAGTATAAAA